MKSTNVTRVSHLVSMENRWQRQGHRGGVLWFTGLPASGTSTLAYALEAHLFEQGYEVFAFDSARLRQGLNTDLEFTREDRRENIRRASELAAVMARAGIVVIAGFISPYVTDRAAARRAAGDGFHEIYLSAPLEVCESRDDRGRYVRARAGGLADFTGIDAPYESPDNPDVTLDTATLSVDACVDRLSAYVAEAFRVP